MDQLIPHNLYGQLMEINRQAFSAGLFNVAYHALEGAFYCATEINSSEALDIISRVAQEEIEWIDENTSGYKHSTAASRQRGMQRSIYSNLSKKAQNANRWGNKRKGP